VTEAVRRLILFLWIGTCVGACSPVATDGAAKSDSTSTDSLRIVTLSPHLAELVFAVGSGGQVVGVSAYTDFPVEAAALPLIGDAFNLDQEQLALLEPDLLLAWDTGTPAHVVDELRARGYNVEVITTTTLADVSAALRKIGTLTNNRRKADEVAAGFSNALADIADNSRGAAPITVFYQVDARPLYTINGGHFVSQLIDLCGGTNIFADLDGLAPLVSVEAVLERDPEVMLASTDAGDDAFDEWDRWPDLAANRYGNRFLMPANDIGRPTPRLLDGARAVCEALDESRRNRMEKLDD
jgi:iron complex transport system substrate-binding protein